MLVIEDQKSLREDIVAYLSDKQIICEAEEKLATFDDNVVLINLMLPQGKGLDLVRMLREMHSKCCDFDHHCQGFE